MVPFKVFTILLLLSGPPGEPPTVVRTVGDADTLAECCVLAKQAEAIVIRSNLPVKAVCARTEDLGNP